MANGTHEGNDEINKTVSSSKAETTTGFGAI